MASEALTDGERAQARHATNLVNQAFQTEAKLKQLKRELRSLGFRYADGTLTRLDAMTSGTVELLDREDA